MTRADDSSVQIQWSYGGDFQVEMEVHSEGRYRSLVQTVTLPGDVSDDQFTPDPVPRGWFYFRFREKQTCEEKGRTVSGHGRWGGQAKAYLSGRAMFRKRDPDPEWVPDSSVPTGTPTSACPSFCPGDRYRGQCHAGGYRYYTIDKTSRGNPSIGIWPQYVDTKPIDSPVVICGHDEGGAPTQCEWVVVRMRATCSSQ